MGKREELVDLAARAWWGAMADEFNPWDALSADEQEELKVGAGASLNAILAGLIEPSEEMIAAGGKAMHWDGWRHDVDDYNFTPEEYEADPQLRRSFERTARPTWQAMLSVLEETSQ